MMALGVSILGILILYKDIKEFIDKKMWRMVFEHRIRKFGFTKILLQYLFLSLSVFIVSFYFSLPLHLSIQLLLISVVGFTLLLSWLLRFHNNIHDFNQFILIGSHLCAQFKVSHKVLNALEEVALVVDESHKVVVEKLIQVSYVNGDILKEFRTMNNHYLLHSMVSMMIHAETYGDQELDRGLSLIERDLDALLEDVYHFIDEIFIFRRKLVLLCVFGVCISLISRNMLGMVLDIVSSPYYQNTAYFFLLVIVMVLVLAHRLFIKDLIMEEEGLR